MVLHEGTISNFLDGVRSATARITAEKLYKRLLKNGGSVDIASHRDIPGSRVLVGELLLYGFVEHKANPGSGEYPWEMFHDLCIHPIARDGRFISYAMPYRITTELRVNPKKRSRIDLSNDQSGSDIGAGNIEMQVLSRGKKKGKKSESGQGKSSVEAEPGSGIHHSDTDGSRNSQRKHQQICDTSESSYTRDDSSTDEYGNYPAIGCSIRDIAYARFRKNVLEGILHTASDTYAIDGVIQCRGKQKGCSVLWNSRLANVFTLVSNMEGAATKLECGSCRELLMQLRSSFIYNLLRICNYNKRLEDVDALYQHVFQDIIQFYCNGDAIMGTFFAHVSKLIYYSKIENAENVNAQVNQLGLVVTGWLGDRRIHGYIDRFAKLNLPQLVCGAFMRLLDKDDGALIDKCHLMLFRDAFTCFIMNYLAYLVDDICGGQKLVYDPYVSKGINYIYHLNSRLHIINCMIENYVATVASISSKIEDECAHIMYMVASPLLGNENIYKWILGLHFRDSDGDEMRRQCRLAVMVLYTVAVNYHQPFLKAEAVNCLRRFQGVPWVSLLCFCSGDPVTNHMVAPIAFTMIQSSGEGAILNCTFRYTFLTSLDEVISEIQQSDIVFHGYRDTRFAMLERTGRETLYAHITTMWPPILTAMFNDNVISMPLSFLVYFATAHLLPIVWNEDLDKYNDMEEDEKKRSIYVSPKMSIELNWTLHIINMMYCLEPTICDLSILDCIIVNFVMHKATIHLHDIREILTLHTGETQQDTIQNVISSNYIALTQNPVNMLLRMPNSITVKSFILRPFCNCILQLLCNLYRDICYGYPSFSMSRKTRLGITYINALQEASILNLVMELANDRLPRTIEDNIGCLISMITSKATFTDDIISSTGLPMSSLLAYVDLCVSEEKLFEKVTERFAASVEMLVNNSNNCNKSDVENVSIAQRKKDNKAFLSPYSSGDVATYHLYNVLLRVIEIPELSKITNIPAEDPNAQRFMMVVNLYWRCFQMSGGNNPILGFVKNSLPIVVRLHYLCPWMINNSTEMLQTWIHNDKAITPELQNIACGVIKDLRGIYQELKELESVEDT